MMGVILLVLAVLWHVAASAAEMLPPHLTGTWSTGQSLYAGTAAQSEMHLQADGLGMFVGSTAPAQRLDGVKDETPSLRAVIGLLLRATLDGDTLTARPFLPGGKRAEETARLVISCRYAAAGPTLTCIGLDGVPLPLKRRSETVPAEAAHMLDTIRLQDAGRSNT